MIVMSGLCLFLSIVLLFGVFVVGILVVLVLGEWEEVVCLEIGVVVFGFFILVYFVIVGF